MPVAFVYVSVCSKRWTSSEHAISRHPRRTVPSFSLFEWPYMFMPLYSWSVYLFDMVFARGPPQWRDWKVLYTGSTLS